MLTSQEQLSQTQCMQDNDFPSSWQSLPMYMTVALSKPSACIFLDSDISEVPWHSGICMDVKEIFAL